MAKNMKDVVIDAALIAVTPGGFAKLLVDMAIEAVKKTDELNSQPTPKLREIAERQELEQRINQAKAKVAQEYAIAARIQTALEVEMEESYEYVGGGSLGAQANINTGDAGFNVGGGVRRLSKRIYRFRGGECSGLFEAAAVITEA